MNVYTVIIYLVFGGIDSVKSFATQEEAHAFILRWSKNHTHNGAFETAQDALKWFDEHQESVEYAIALHTHVLELSLYPTHSVSSHEGVKHLFEVERSLLSQKALDLFYSERADFVPIHYERDGHFFHRSTVEEMADAQSYDACPCEEVLKEIKHVYDQMVQTKASLLYLRYTHEPREDVL